MNSQRSRETWGKFYWKDSGQNSLCFCGIWGAHSLSMDVFTHTEAPGTHALMDFMEASSCKRI